MQSDLNDFGESIDELTSGQSIEKVQVNVYFRRLAVHVSDEGIVRGLDIVIPARKHR